MTDGLELAAVSKAYGSLRVVDDVSLAVAPGERRAVIGPNGAGKTTLFDLVGGRTPVTAGAIRYRGLQITTLPEHRRALLGIAKTFQRSNLFDDLSVQENVALAVQRRAGVSRHVLRPLHAYRDVARRSEELLERTGLAEVVAAPAGDLSHGARRQLEVAVALALEPGLLLLDEPAAGMSAAERLAFTDLVRALPPTLTVLLIEHDIDLVFAVATRVAVLAAGRVIADGAPEAVARSPQVQEAYLGTPDTRQVFYA